MRRQRVSIRCLEPRLGGTLWISSVDLFASEIRMLITYGGSGEENRETAERRCVWRCASCDINIKCVHAREGE